MTHKLKEAMFYDKLPENAVSCTLCPHRCRITENNVGICNVRKNIEGKLYTLNYEKISAIALDPIEKKPLAYFYPGSFILSVGSVGCNFKCPFCQNHSIARALLEDVNTFNMDSDELVEKALALKEQGNIGIAFTYNEPSIWYEYVYETAQKAKKEGLKNVLVTNGYINKEPLEKLLPYIDAMNIDLKAFSHKFYTEVVKGGLDDVKQTIEIAASKCHVEITTLVIPDLNDSVEEIEKLASWLSSVSPEIPLHLSRYFPKHELNKEATPVEKLRELKPVAQKFLKHVQIGNV